LKIIINIEYQDCLSLGIISRKEKIVASTTQLEDLFDYVLDYIESQSDEVERVIIEIVKEV